MNPVFPSTLIMSVLVLGGCRNQTVPVAPAVKPAVARTGWNDLNKNGKKDIYEDPGQSTEQRIGDLLKQMTQAEKLGQITQGHLTPDKEKGYAGPLRLGEVGSLLPGGGAVGNPELRNRLQKIAVEESRLGIPFILGFDSIHGFRTIFPIPLAQASAWEPELFEKTQAVSAFESSAGGIDWAFAPMVDLARDPRWGRIAEGFGEDPWLGSLCAAAAVRGFQGKDASDPRRIVACLKHYVAYGAAEGGRDYNTTDLSEYQLRNFYLPQFHAGVDAGALTLMSAFNCINGVPASANHHTLTEILRGEWGFKGFVVSDWTAITELMPHGVAANDADCARLGITAGVDMEMLSTTYRGTLDKQIKEGKVQQAVIDEAVRRILRVKFQRGLFDRPYVDETWQQNAYLQPDALALARQAVIKSCVLLKNDKEILPLSRNGVKLVALIGPMANEKGELIGSWPGNGKAADVVPLADGLRARLGPDASLTVAKGCSLIKGKRTITRTDGVIVEDPNAPKDQAGDAEFAAAVQTAGTADIVILALGEPAGWSGENATRTELGLTGRQEELFEAVAATGKPVIVILFNGRPLAIPRLKEKASAILEAWQPGSQGGNAIADLLFGDASPSGRLTATFPLTVGQVPVYYNRLNTGRPGNQNYRDSTSKPLFPFGYGLTYTSFSYSSARLSTTTLKSGDTLTVTATITNTGKRAGDEVVQLYLRDPAATRARPVRELKGFRKIHLEPGASQEVMFTIGKDQLGFFDETGRWLVEPGRFEAWIAPDAASGTPIAFELK
jgi:beta-glucosidase